MWHLSDHLQAPAVWPVCCASVAASKLWKLDNILCYIANSNIFSNFSSAVQCTMHLTDHWTLGTQHTLHHTDHETLGTRHKNSNNLLILARIFVYVLSIHIIKKACKTNPQKEVNKAASVITAPGATVKDLFDHQGLWYVCQQQRPGQQQTQEIDPATSQTQVHCSVRFVWRCMLAFKPHACG